MNYPDAMHHPDFSPDEQARLANHPASHDMEILDPSLYDLDIHVNAILHDITPEEQASRAAAQFYASRAESTPREYVYIDARRTAVSAISRAVRRFFADGR